MATAVPVSYRIRDCLHTENPRSTPDPNKVKVSSTTCLTLCNSSNINTERTPQLTPTCILSPDLNFLAPSKLASRGLASNLHTSLYIHKCSFPKR